MQCNSEWTPICEMKMRARERCYVTRGYVTRERCYVTRGYVTRERCYVTRGYVTRA